MDGRQGVLGPFAFFVVPSSADGSKQATRKRSMEWKSGVSAQVPGSHERGGEKGEMMEGGVWKGRTFSSPVSYQPPDLYLRDLQLSSSGNQYTTASTRVRAGRGTWCTGRPSLALRVSCGRVCRGGRAGRGRRGDGEGMSDVGECQDEGETRTGCSSSDAQKLRWPDQRRGGGRTRARR